MASACIPLRLSARATPAAVHEQVGVEAPDEQRVEVDQLHPAELRLDIPPHNLAVALRRRRLQRLLAPATRHRIAPDIDDVAMGVFACDQM